MKERYVTNGAGKATSPIHEIEREVKIFSSVKD
jgi:hypothetical protein